MNREDFKIFEDFENISRGKLFDKKKKPICIEGDLHFSFEMCFKLYVF